MKVERTKEIELETVSREFTGSRNALEVSRWVIMELQAPFVMAPLPKDRWQVLVPVTCVDDLDEKLDELFGTRTDSERQIDALLEIADSNMSPFIMDYASPRMEGKECCGILTDNPDKILEEAVEQGVVGGVTDVYNQAVMVYWPNLKYVSNDEVTRYVGQPVFDYGHTGYLN